ncbi:MAG: DNA cytosine methyltransferase [Chloroflexi bacterium]|nr:MAG: DNA cytosine methyltransferase [Chloroflexota bacterium]
MKSAVSLFAGAGGCSLGFSRAGFEILLAVDDSYDAITTYQHNFPQVTCWQRDIRQILADDVLHAIELQPGGLDFLIGGPPCQGFSSAGAKFWDDPRNELLSHYIRLLEGIRPRWFLMENVEGLLTANNGRYIYEVAKRFLDAGYNLQLHKVYSHWYGLPQERKRVFMIGSSQISQFEFPPATYVEQPTLFNEQTVLTIMDAISDLPPAGRNPTHILQYTSPPQNTYQEILRAQAVGDHWMPDLSDEIRERIAALKPGQTMKDLPPHLQHASFKRRAFRRVMDGTPTEKRGGAPSGIKRLDPDKPCLTITSAAIREFVHPLEDRFLTLRECARIQSFPDDFIFVGQSTAVARMIGNAIPPLIAQLIAKHFSQYLDDNRENNSNQKSGRLLGYYLTKANSMSPALARTDQLLRQLQ